LTFQPATGYGQYFRFMVDGVATGSAVYVADSAPISMLLPYDSSRTIHTVNVCPQGLWPSDEIDVSAQIDSWQLVSSRLKATLTPTLYYFSYGDGDQFSAWALSGVKRFSNVKPVDGKPTWAALDLTMTTSGGTRTIALAVGSVVMASGTVSTGAALPAMVALAEVDSSGLSGTVSLDSYSADVTAGTVVAKYPASYQLHYRTTQFAAPDFPRTAELTAYDDGRSQSLTVRSADLAAGTYYVIAHQTDEGGLESTNLDGGGAARVITAPPAAPGTPVYTSGGVAATVVSFTASTTVGATYNIYDSGETGLLLDATPSATHIAGTGTLTQTLAALTAGWTGTRYILIRAVSGGVEEKNLQMLAIEYASGVVTSPRPPTPAIAKAHTVSGRTVTVNLCVNSADALATAATVEIYLYDPDSTPSYASPDATAVVPAATWGTVVNMSISATAAADGPKMLVLRTKTAGSIYSTPTQAYGPVHLTTTAPAAPGATVEATY
jgi:hypothetical protein